jgi:signal transduction histidine kinase
MVRTMHSLRSRLLTLWLMLAACGAVTGLLLLEFYQQSSNAQVAGAENSLVRTCRELGDRYAFFVTGWSAASAADITDNLKQQLTEVVGAALARAQGIEGGIWQTAQGSLAYAFPTYEGTGPKTDLPQAELATIRQVNAEALRDDGPATVRQVSRSQVLVVHACPLSGPIAGVTAWTMTRVFTGQGRAYNQLLIGLAALALTVLGSAIWLGRILYSWSRNITRLQTTLAAHETGKVDLPALPRTGERELDRLVDALNATGRRLTEERRRAGAAERLAALGRLAAGLAHEIRNPIAAMRLKAENALASDDEGRRVPALRAILEQVGRLDGLLRDLLAMTRHREPRWTKVDLGTFLEQTVEPHREFAAVKGIKLSVGDTNVPPMFPFFDVDQIHRALDNLILNAMQKTPSGGAVAVEAARRDGRLHLRVRDDGPGVPEEIRERLFEPFVTDRADGTGLGLAIVREIARAHGGDARLADASRGAVFEIELPWRQS